LNTVVSIEKTNKKQGKKSLSLRSVHFLVWRETNTKQNKQVMGDMEKSKRKILAVVGW
jgi:hypothetical protein